VRLAPFQTEIGGVEETVFFGVGQATGGKFVFCSLDSELNLLRFLFYTCKPTLHLG
jgi:hypothetical protein